MGDQRALVRRLAILALAACLAPPPADLGATDAAPERAPGSVAAADSLGPAARPRRVPYRSRLESALALPGRALYLPVHGALYAGAWTVSTLWERRVLDRMKEVLTTADGRAGLRPLSNTGVGTGFRLFHRDFLAGADWQLISSFGRSARHRQHHKLELSWGSGQTGALRLELDFAREPGESFYGVGNRTSPDERSRFLHEEALVQLVYGRHLGSRLELAGHLGCATADIAAGRYGSGPATADLYTGDQLPGLTGRTGAVRAAISLRSSLVDEPGSPTRGSIARLTAGVEHDLGGRLSHAAISVVTEQFFELFHRRTASIRAGTDWRMGLGNDEVPFYSLASVGGNLFVRGYQRGRFRDRGAAFAALIYRFPVTRLLDAGLFYETGRTFHGPADFSLRHWHPSLGGGLCIWIPGGVVFQQQVAVSDEERRLLFSFSTDF